MTEIPGQVYRRDTRLPNGPYHPTLPNPCGHPFDAPHGKTHYTNNPPGIGGYICDQDAPRIEGVQQTAFEDLGPPQMEMF